MGVGILQLNDVCGKLAYMDGQFLMIKPKGEGSWPVIEPSANVVTFHKGEELLEPSVVESVEDLVAVPKNKAPVSTFQLTVSEDGMEVILHTKFEAGETYRLKAQGFSRRFRLIAEKGEEVPPAPINPEAVFHVLNQKGFKGELDQAAVISVCTSLENASVVVLRGRPPIPPIDGRVEIICDLKPRYSPITNLEDWDRINLFEREQFNSVEEGDVLARWHPPVPGLPGWNVYGERVAPPAPKEARFRVGSGVKLIEGGRIAVAATAGRPIIEHDRLCVKRHLTLPSSVNVSTGNVRFKGNVAIGGNVEETLTVKAGGWLDIKGSVYHARTAAGKDVVIRGKAIGSHITAGHRHPALAKLGMLLQEVQPELRHLYYMISPWVEQTADSDFEKPGVFVKTVLEKSFPDLPKRLHRLARWAEFLESQTTLDDYHSLFIRIQQASQNFVGAEPLRYKNMKAVADDIHALEDACYTLNVMLERAHVRMRYCQNSVVEASGVIEVTGPLVYDCEFMAGEAIFISGHCRVGRYWAGKVISAHSLGAPGMGSTYAAVDEGGMISADIFYPGVRLQIGRSKMILDIPCRNKTFFVRDGSWESRPRHVQELRKAY